MVWFTKLFAKLLFWLYDFLDAIGELFSVLAGTTTFEYDGDDNVTILDVFINHSGVTQVFLSIFIISVAVVAIFTIVGVVKNVVAVKAENRHPQGHTLGLGLTALLATLLMFAVLLGGIQLSNFFLKYVSLAFTDGESLTLSQQLFDASVISGQYEYVEADPDETTVIDYYVFYVTAEDTYYVIGDGTPETVKDETSRQVTYYIIGGVKVAVDNIYVGDLMGAADPYEYSQNGEITGFCAYLAIGSGDLTYNVDQYVESSFTDIVIGNHEYSDWYATYDEDGSPLVYRAYTLNEYSGNRTVSSTGWNDGYSAADIDFSTATVDEVFGTYKTNMLDWETESKGYKTHGYVDLDNFNFWTAYLAVIIILVAMIWAMLGLVKRIYDILFLIVVLPLISATLPLDEGARFKAWRDTMASKVLLAYGAVISVNIFLIMLPVIGNVAAAVGEALSKTYAASILKIMLYAGGALSISGGQLLLARLLGTDASEARDLAQSARTALSIGGSAAAGVGVAKRLAVGGTNKYGRQRRGVIPSTLGVGNKAGETIGGERYMRSTAGATMSSLSRAPMTQQRADAARQRENLKNTGTWSGEGGVNKQGWSRTAKKEYNSALKEYKGMQTRAENKDFGSAEYSQNFRQWAKTNKNLDFDDKKTKYAKNAKEMADAKLATKDRLSGVTTVKQPLSANAAGGARTAANGVKSPVSANNAANQVKVSYGKPDKASTSAANGNNSIKTLAQNAKPAAAASANAPAAKGDNIKTFAQTPKSANAASTNAPAANGNNSIKTLAQTPKSANAASANAPAAGGDNIKTLVQATKPDNNNPKTKSLANDMVKSQTAPTQQNKNGGSGTYKKEQ